MNFTSYNNLKENEKKLENSLEEVWVYYMDSVLTEKEKEVLENIYKKALQENLKEQKTFVNDYKRLNELTLRGGYMKK